MFCPKIVLLALAAAGLLMACAAPEPAAGVDSIEAAPLDRDVYVRGTFNGWGTADRFDYVGAGIYQATVKVSPGAHGFKVAPADWSFEWLVDASDGVAVNTDKAYPLASGKGPEDFFVVAQSGSYQFRLDITDRQQPILSISQQRDVKKQYIDPHKDHQQRQQVDYSTFDQKTETVIFSVEDMDADERHYSQSSTMTLRDPGAQFIRYQEVSGQPKTRTGSLAFDALFAMSMNEMRQDSVSHLRDGNYSNGREIPCDCFETGEKWHFVWTRDLSYAADLGLALLDPQRVRNSLEFKLSGYRDGILKSAVVAGTADGLQIMQDTGSGGSWPVSTDRVTWVFGAAAVLKTLDQESRQGFARQALKALGNTIENDRLAAFDPRDGLYTGEQSFLDWREQTYPSWITSDLASMASAKALSTNVVHFQALMLAAELADEMGQQPVALKYRRWAGELKQAINTVFWLDDVGLYSSLTAGHHDGAALHKFDWLGVSLAVLSGVASDERAQRALANYPHGAMGAPVIFPQQPDTPVYHNRAIWPFVTAYGLRAAIHAGNVGVADAAYATLMRGAAVNLSNMENLEWLTGQPMYLETQNPTLSGPVINSKRQLWSVGAYLGMVIHNVFGLQIESGGIRVAPFITGRLHSEVFAGSQHIELQDISLRGKSLTIDIYLPGSDNQTGTQAGAPQGVYSVASVQWNGKPNGPTLDWSQFDSAKQHHLTIQLGPLVASVQPMTQVSADPAAKDPQVFAPREPVLESVVRDQQGQVLVEFSDNSGNADASYNLYRNGQLVQDKLAPGQHKVAAPTALTDARGAECYAVEAVFASGTHSHHSQPLCLDAGQEIPVTDRRVVSNVALAPANSQLGVPFIPAWGRPEDSLRVVDISLEHKGRYSIQLKYDNAYNTIGQGITCGVKWLRVTDHQQRPVAEGVIQLPQGLGREGAKPLLYSTPLSVELEAGNYTLEVLDFYNMSYLQTNTTYSGNGGSDGAVNRFDLVALRIQPGF